jgi:outer membrane protein assembly factor BamB
MMHVKMAIIAGCLLVVGNTVQAQGAAHKGPKKVWQSELIPTAKEGGYGSVVVVDGKAYLFVGLKEPLVTRRIGGGDRWAIDLGLAPEGADRLPDKLVKTSEAARLSPARGKLQNFEDFHLWADDWLAKNLNADEQKKYGGFVKKRFQDGPDALPMALLAALEEARKKDFTNQAELDKWFVDHGIEGRQLETVMRIVPMIDSLTSDAIFCLDAKTGRTLWKKAYPNAPMPDGKSSGSSTPAVFNGRVYASGRLALYCLNAQDGAEIWKRALPDGGASNSSPLLVDGMVVVRSGSKLGLAAYDAEDGKRLWPDNTIAPGRGCLSLAMAWVKDGKSYLLCNDDRDVFCLEAKTGKIVWSVPRAGDGSPVVVGDDLVTASGRSASRTMPGNVDGMMFVRTDNHVACFDLTQAAQ